MRFAVILRRVERKTMVVDDRTYKAVGVRWYGKGAFIREELGGLEISRKQQWIIKAGDVVYNKLFAWKGAFAVGDASIDGHIVSDKFPTYEINEELVDREYLMYYFQTPEIAQQAFLLSKGAAAISKLTLNPPQFWELTIPLPSLPAQRRIVERLQYISHATADIEALHSQSTMEADRIVSREIDRLVTDNRWPVLPLGELLSEPSRNGLSPRPSDAPPGSPILRISAATRRFDGLVDETDYKYLVEAGWSLATYALRGGDLLACRFNGNLRFVGKIALYAGESGVTQVYPDKLIRFRVDRVRVVPAFVQLAMSTQGARSTIETMAATTAGNIGIGAGQLKSVPIPVPPLPQQTQIVERVNALRTGARQVAALHSLAGIELQSLVPTSMNRAYGGRL